AAVAPGTIERCAFAIAEASQLGDEAVDRDAPARIELERRRVDLRREIPSPRLELAADLNADQRGVRRESDDEHGRAERGDADQAAADAAPPAARSLRRLTRGLLLARARACVSSCGHFESESVARRCARQAYRSLSLCASPESDALSQQSIQNRVAYPIAHLVAQPALDDLAEVRPDLGIGHGAAQDERQRLADEAVHRFAAADSRRAGQLRLERVVEPLRREHERAPAG